MDKVKLVTSRSNPQWQRLRRLALDPSAYRKQGEVWVEGEHLCAAYLARGGVPRCAVIDTVAWEQPSLRALVGRAETVIVVAPALMAALSTLESPAPIGLAIGWPGPGEIVAGRPSVVLDRLQDAGNVGAILRSAAAFGFAQIVALKGTAALWSPKVMRAGMGAHFALNLVEGVEPEMLGALGSPLLATSPRAAERIDGVALPWPCAWVVGHEGQGIGATVLERCALRLAIPQPGGEESLNAAAAAAVCLYESVRQRLAHA
jgi:TrmH family RNA methyltransferase